MIRLTKKRDESENKIGISCFLCCNSSKENENVILEKIILDEQLKNIFHIWGLQDNLLENKNENRIILTCKKCENIILTIKMTYNSLILIQNQFEKLKSEFIDILTKNKTENLNYIDTIKKEIENENENSTLLSPDVIENDDDIEYDDDDDNKDSDSDDTNFDDNKESDYSDLSNDEDQKMELVDPEPKKMKPVIVCPIENCEFSHIHELTLIKHVKSVHEEEEGSKELESIGLNFDLIFTPEGRLQCSYCKIKSYKLFGQLKRHVNFHRRKIQREEKIKRIKENIKVGNDKKDLNVKKDKKPEKRRFKEYPKKQCSICERLFNPKAFSQHYKTHLSPNFKCEICGKTTTNSGDLKKHQVIHEENRKKFLCNECGLVFLIKQNFEIHMTTHQNNKVQCKICHKIIPSPRILRRHMETCHSEADTKCKICGKMFKKLRLKKHMMTVHVEPKYSCEICGHKTKTPNNLKIHKKSHNKN